MNVVGILRSTFLLISLLSYLPTTFLWGWSEHALGVYSALEASPTLTTQEEVVAEELKIFLLRHEKKLEQLLAEEEDWARANLKHYAPLPDSLRFKAGQDKTTILTRFAYAIRIHPGLLLDLYIQANPRTGCRNRQSLIQKQTVFQNKNFLKGIQFCQLKAGEKVHPIVVIATAADEPDHGMDIGLFEDNHTPHGAQYAFGPQPFGDPRLEYGSQAPFHMGFYHESPIVYAAAPYLQQTYPEYRIRLYRQLGIFALRQGHPYWGYRFLGWGLHYITDLTQPYHASVLPGVSMLKMLWINLLSLLGFSSAKEEAVQLVSNRHTALEELQWRLVREHLSQHKTDSLLLLSFADNSSDAQYPTYSDSYAREIIAREARQRAQETDELLLNTLPEIYVNDPKFEYTPANKEKLFLDTKTFDPQAYITFQQYLATLGRSFGAHSRKYLESALFIARSL